MRRRKYVPRNSPERQLELTKRYTMFPSDREISLCYDIIKIFYGNNFNGKPLHKMPQDKAFRVSKGLYNNSWKERSEWSRDEEAAIETLLKLRNARNSEERFDLEEMVCIQTSHLPNNHFIVRDYLRLTGQKGYDSRKTNKTKKMKADYRETSRQGDLF